MTHVGYLVAGYGLTIAVLAGYVLRLRSRARSLARAAAGSSGPPPSQGGSPTSSDSNPPTASPSPVAGAGPQR